jgi:protein transport protein SEC13
MADAQAETTQLIPKLFIETQHDDRIHDIQFDFYGRRLATCSADGKIKVFECAGPAGGTGALQSARVLAELQASTNGPVWQVSWAHPRFGTVLGSCGFDGRAVIWAEPEPPAWPGGARTRPGAGLQLQPIYEHCVHEPASVNAIAFAPPEYGLVFACAASDGRVSVCRRDEHDGSWRTEWVGEPASGIAHQLGATCVSWAPASPVTRKEANELADTNEYWSPMRLATGGCDKRVRIWTYDSVSESWRIEGDLAHPDNGVLAGHTDWVRAVAWCPSRSAGDLLATAGQDQRVLIWRRLRTASNEQVSRQEGGQWSYVELPRFKAPCWGLSWSTAGLFLAVSCGDHTVSLWKQKLNGEWTQVAEATEAGAQAIRAREQASMEQASSANAMSVRYNASPTTWTAAGGGATTTPYSHAPPVTSPRLHPGMNPMIRPSGDAYHPPTGPITAGSRPDGGASRPVFAAQTPAVGSFQGQGVPSVGPPTGPAAVTNAWAPGYPTTGGRPPPANLYGPPGMVRHAAPPPPPPSTSPGATNLQSPALRSARAPPPPLPSVATGMMASTSSFLNAQGAQLMHQPLPPPTQVPSIHAGAQPQAPYSVRPPAQGPNAPAAPAYQTGAPGFQAGSAYLRPNVPSATTGSYDTGNWNPTRSQGPQNVAPPPSGPAGMLPTEVSGPGVAGYRTGNLQAPPPPPYR